MTGYVLGAGEGSTYDWRGARVAIKAAATHTHAQLAVMESTYPAGLLVPEHFHDGEDEMLYILAGTLEGSCGDESWQAAAGSFVFVPRGITHGFTVTSATQARALVIVGPPKLDAQVIAGGTPV